MKSDEKAFREVVGNLISRKLRPGDRVFEPGLCQELGMSRTPVRQALSRLIEAGILIKFPHQKGYMVPELSLEDMKKIFSARSVIEGECAFFATEECSEKDLSFLKVLNAREEECFYDGDSKTFAEINETFHFSLYDLCRNAYLKKFATHLYWRSQLYTFCRGFFYSPGFIKDGIRMLKKNDHVNYHEHRRIIDAIENHGPEEARNVMKAHIHRAYEYYVKAKAVDLSASRNRSGSHSGGGV